MLKVFKFITIKNSLILLISTFLISQFLNFTPLFSYIIFNFFFKEPDQNTNQEEVRKYYEFYEFSDLILDSTRNIVSMLLPILIILMLLSLFGLIYSVIKKYKSKK